MLLCEFSRLMASWRMRCLGTTLERSQHGPRCRLSVIFFCCTPVNPAPNMTLTQKPSVYMDMIPDSQWNSNS